jgi:hypothetical protein
MIPEAKPTWIQRLNSSGLVCGRLSAKKPPMSEPQRETPESPIDRPLRTADSRPSKPQSIVGSPPQTIGELFAEPVHPERT